MNETLKLPLRSRQFRHIFPEYMFVVSGVP